MKHTLFVSLFIINIISSYASTTDSLKRYINSHSGIKKAEALVELALELKKTSKDTALTYAQEAYNIANKKHNLEYTVKATNAKAVILISKNDLNSADSLYKFSLKISEQNNFDKGLMLTYNGMAKLYSKAAAYEQALEYGKQSIKYSEKINDKKTLAKTYLTIGNTYYYMGNLDQSIKMFEKSLALYQLENNESGVSGVSMNIGVIAFQSGKYEKSLKYYTEALKSFKKLKDTLNIGMTLENISITLHNQGNTDSALTINLKALELYKKIDNEAKIASSMENVALSYSAKGDIAKALKLQLKAIKIKEKINDKRGLGYSLINLGSYYQKLNQLEKNLTYVKKALNIFIEIKDNYNIARAKGALAGAYYNMKEYDKGIEEATNALKLNKELNNSSGIAGSYLTLGNLYNKKGNKKEALNYYLQSLKLNEDIGDATDIAGLNSNIGVIYYDLGEYKKAKQYYDKALKLREKIGVKLGIIESYKTLANVHSKLNNYKVAFDYLYQYADGKEELLNENITKQLAEMDAKYESEKKEQEIALLQKEGEIEKTKHEAETRRNNIIIYSGSGFGVLLIVLAFVLFKSNNQKKKSNQLLSAQNEEITKQRDEVEHQKLIVEEKNKEITDSIQYAKRIQEAILPPTKVVKEYLTESFIYYKPKDIVAGDFYWMECLPTPSFGGANKTTGSPPSGELEGAVVLFAAADCTGHGVPGAMVSVICNNGLNRSVREYGITDPGKILDKTREIVVQEFEKSEEEVKDGMDIALCSLQLNSPFEGGERGMTLKYAGAHNPLWIIRGGELLETKANKQPIGKFDNPEPYTTHTIELQKGDSIYIFSDGFADQFGGEKGKKLKTTNFKQLLISIQNETMEKQKQLIDEAFEDWKGSLEQLDDVCVIGVRI